MTSQTKPSGSDSTGYWIDLKLHALTSFEPYFTKIQDRTWFDDPRLQTNDFLIIDFVMKNQKNFDYVKPYYKLYTSVELSQRAYKLHMFQQLNLGNVQFRKSKFFFTIKFLLFLTSDLLVWVKWRWEFLSKLKSHVEKFFSKNRFHQKVQNSRENRHRPIPRRLAWNKSELWKKILHRFSRLVSRCFWTSVFNVEG